MKKCPYCAEEIQDDAIKCRFCQEPLEKKKMSCWKGCFVGCLALFAGITILMILFSLLSFLLLKFFVFKIQIPSMMEFWNKFLDLLNIGPGFHTV